MRTLPSPHLPPTNHSQSRDSSRTHLHLHSAHHADLFEEFTRIPLLPDTIFLPPQHQPINPEDEDDVVPDQHAAFGITKATRENREVGWRDLRLQELVAGTGAEREGQGVGTAGSATGVGRMEGNVQGNGQPTVGPVSGVVGVPMGVRQGMRSVGVSPGVGSSLRG